MILKDIILNLFKRTIFDLKHPKLILKIHFWAFIHTLQSIDLQTVSQGNKEK